MCSYTCRALVLYPELVTFCWIWIINSWKCAEFLHCYCDAYCIEQLCTQIYICLCNWWKQLKIKRSIYYIACSCFTVRCYVSVYRFRLLRSKENASSVPFDSLKATSSLTALTCLVYVDLVLGFSVFFLYCAVFYVKWLLTVGLVVCNSPTWNIYCTLRNFSDHRG